MTRKLSPVPDAPRSGVDVAELRRNLAPAAPASLQALQPPASHATAPADSRSPLREARIALQDAVAVRDRCEARRVELLHQEAIGTHRRVLLEADLAGALARGDAPEARRSRESLEDWVVELTPLAESLRQAETDFQRACSAAQRAESALRQAALAVIASRFEGLLERYVETVKAHEAAEHEVTALPRFLETNGYDAWQCYRLKARIDDALKLRLPPGMSGLNAPTPGDLCVRQLRAQFERLIAGEEG